MAATKVFISYSHDSPEHMARVLFFSDNLRKKGVDCQLDQYEEAPPEGWPRWCKNQVTQSEFVLAVCTATYERRYDGNEEVGQGKGVVYEGYVITQLIYDNQGQNTKFVPVLFSAADFAHVPIDLKGSSIYDLSNPELYTKLYARLTKQKLITKPELGPVETVQLHNVLSPGTVLERYQREKPALPPEITTAPQLSALKQKTDFAAPTLGIFSLPRPSGTDTFLRLKTKKKATPDGWEKTHLVSSADPAIYAKFELEKGKPVQYGDSYRIWVATKNVPAGTDRVMYEILDDTFTEPRFTVDKTSKDFRDWITSYGDVVITAKGEGSAGPWQTKANLFEALREARPKPSPPIKKALKDIEDN
jgi:hypothetical protein